MPGYGSAFGLTASAAAATYDVHLIRSSLPGGIAGPGDHPTFTFQIVSTGGQAIQAQGRVELIPYGTQRVPGDIWTPLLPRQCRLVSAGMRWCWIWDR